MATPYSSTIPLNAGFNRWSDSTLSKRFFSPSILIGLLVVFSIVSLYFNLLGRGLRTTWPLLGLWGIIAGIESLRYQRQLVVSITRLRWEIFCFILFILAIVANFAVGRGYTGLTHFYLISTGFGCYLIGMAYSSRGDRSYEFFLSVLIVILGLEALRSIPSLLSSYGAGRMLMSERGDMEMIAAGIGDYNIYTATAVSLPCMLAIALRRKLVPRLILLGCCLAIAVAVSLSTFTGAVMIMLFGSGTFLLWSTIANRRGNILFRLIFLSIILSIIWLFIYPFVKDTRQFEFVTEKFERTFINVTEKGYEAEGTGRAQLAQMSFNTFIENPLFGIGPVTGQLNESLYTSVGGHSSWFDQLAEYGIVGFGPFIALMVLLLIRLVRQWRQNPKNILIQGRLISYAMFVFCGIINPSLLAMHIFVLFILFTMSDTRTSLEMA